MNIKKYSCDQCGLKKTTMHELKVHINYHTKEKLYKVHFYKIIIRLSVYYITFCFQCDYCELTFTSMGNRGRHMKGKSNTFATLILKLSKNRFSLVVHLGIKAFVCKYCKQSFGKKETLNHHEMRHTGIKNHVCEVKVEIFF